MFFTRKRRKSTRIDRRKTQNVSLSDYYRRGGNVGICGLRTFIESPVLDVMLIFAVPFGVGLVLYLVLNANIKQPAQKNYVNRFEFNDETLDIATMQHDEVIATYKLHYNEIVKVKETEKYYFVYIAKFSAYIISKENLTEDEKNKINKLLKIPNQHKPE